MDRCAEDAELLNCCGLSDLLGNGSVRHTAWTEYGMVHEVKQQISGGAVDKPGAGARWHIIPSLFHTLRFSLLRLIWRYAFFLADGF